MIRAARVRRPLALTALALLPLAWAPLDAFARDHAFLVNASPSLPNWAFWLDKAAPIRRGSLIFFEPPPSDLVTRHFGKGPQLFGKRVLGIPGDTVSHRGSDVFINGRRVATRLAVTRLGIALEAGPEGRIPEGCFYAGSAHARGLDSRYAAIGFVCRDRVLGTGSTVL